jgi:Zn-dependent protease
MGHVLAARIVGLPVTAPIFIPFFGAFIGLKKNPVNAKQDAFIGLAGPYAGCAFAVLCVMLYFATMSPYWAALAQITLLINLFNLMPLYPMDGGRAAMALSPWLWVVGVVAFFAVGAWANPFLLMIMIFSVPRMIAMFTNRAAHAQYLSMAPQERYWIAAAYFGLAVVAALGMHEMHNLLVRGHGGPGGLI